jgi:translation initiation factor IF-3
MAEEAGLRPGRRGGPPDAKSRPSPKILELRANFKYSGHRNRANRGPQEAEGHRDQGDQDAPYESTTRTNDVKKAVKRFFEEVDKVKVTLRFRAGRWRI